MRWKPTWKSLLAAPVGTTGEAAFRWSCSCSLVPLRDRRLERRATGSMKPTILEGDRVFVNKLAYDLRVPFTRIRLGAWARPERGDIVVLDSPHDGKRLVKRVIGIPGDRVEMRRYRLIINEQRPTTRSPPRPTGLGHLVARTIDGRSHLIWPRRSGPRCPPSSRSPCRRSATS